jgi:predicted phage terminase large subunit-like protein
VRFSPESGDKVVRATPVAAQAEAGNLYLVRGPWNDAYINELVVFPNGQFKDQTDATSRMYSNLLRKGERTVGLGPKLIQAVA